MQSRWNYLSLRLLKSARFCEWLPCAWYSRCVWTTFEQCKTQLLLWRKQDALRCIWTFFAQVLCSFEVPLKPASVKLECICDKSKMHLDASWHILTFRSSSRFWVHYSMCTSKKGARGSVLEADLLTPGLFEVLHCSLFTMQPCTWYSRYIWTIWIQCNHNVFVTKASCTWVFLTFLTQVLDSLFEAYELK